MTDHTDPTPAAQRGQPRRDLLTFDRSDRWGLAVLLGAVVARRAGRRQVVDPLVALAARARP